MGEAVFLPSGQIMVGVTSFKKTHTSVPQLPGLMYSAPYTSCQAAADPHLHRRLPHSHGQVWLSLLWGHCSFLLSRTATCILLRVSASQMKKLALSILQRLANKRIKPVLYLAAYPVLYYYIIYILYIISNFYIEISHD